MEPLKEQPWRPTRQSGSKLRALQTLPRGSVAPSNIEAPTLDREVMMREAFGVREACFRFGDETRGCRRCALARRPILRCNPDRPAPISSIYQTAFPKTLAE